jgi:hypothetical protein
VIGNREVIMPGLIVTSPRAVAVAVLVAAAAGCTAGHPGAADAHHPAVTAHSHRAQAAPHAPELPGIYLGLGAGPWYGPKVRPRTLLLGADWTVTRIRWTDWTRQHADGRGYYVACRGAGGPCDDFWAVIRVTHVREHRGARYFAIMKITIPIRLLVRASSSHINNYLRNFRIAGAPGHSRPRQLTRKVMAS